MFSSNKKSIGQLKIEKKIQKLLLVTFQKSDIYINNQKIIISSLTTNISPNFKNLKIYIDLFNIDKIDKENFIKELNKKYIYVFKDVIAKEINLKFVPEIQFYSDNSSEKSYKMEQLLNEESKKYNNKIK